MFEKVNSMHPDKIADRIGGAIVDLGYKKMENPIIAGECLIGHENCHIIIETNVDYTFKDIKQIVDRITGDSSLWLDLQIVEQDEKLAKNQSEEIRCGDNGIFKGVIPNEEEQELTKIAQIIYNHYKSDGKYLINSEEITVCQSNVKNEELENWLKLTDKFVTINPIGEWTGGLDVDTGATNRKLGSDMGRAVTGGGLHFKDLSKANVSLNIFCHLKTRQNRQDVMAVCNIGDIDIKFYDDVSSVLYIPYKSIVEEAKDYIVEIGGFESFAE